MSRMPAVSIILVNYNGQSYIGECIQSVLATEYPSFEIVVVDNNSTDTSPHFLKLLQKQKKIKYIPLRHNSYFTGGCNRGAQAAQGKFLVFLNSDTTVTPDWLTEMVGQIKNDRVLLQPKILLQKKKDIIDNAGGRYVFPGFGFGIGRGKPDTKQYNRTFPIDYVNGTCCMISRRFFHELGGFDDWYKMHYDDVDLSFRAKKRGGQTLCVGTAVIYHKQSQSIKTHMDPHQLSLFVRKNALMTVAKQFNKSEKWLRLTCMVGVFIIKDIAHLNNITLPAVRACIKYEKN